MAGVIILVVFAGYQSETMGVASLYLPFGGWTLVSRILEASRGSSSVKRLSKGKHLDKQDQNKLQKSSKKRESPQTAQTSRKPTHIVWNLFEHDSCLNSSGHMLFGSLEFVGFLEVLVCLLYFSGLILGFLILRGRQIGRSN